MHAATVIVILSNSMWNESEQTSNLPLGLVHNAVSLPCSDRQVTEMPALSQTTLVWPQLPHFFFLPGMLNRLPPVLFCACVFIGWMSHSQKTPPECWGFKLQTNDCHLVPKSPFGWEQTPPAYNFSQKRKYFFAAVTNSLCAALSVLFFISFASANFRTVGSIKVCLVPTK